MDNKIINIIVVVLSLVIFTSCVDTINWSHLESIDDKVSLKYPPTVEQTYARNGAISLSDGYVNLIGRGKLEEPWVIMRIYDKDSDDIPFLSGQIPWISNVDVTDPLSLVDACSKSSVQQRTSGEVQTEFEILDAPQTTSFNGYDGARLTFKNKHFFGSGREKKPYYTIITYDAVIIDDKRIICVHGGMGENKEGAALLPSYIDKVLNTIELY